MTAHPPDLDLYTRRLDTAHKRVPTVLDHLNEQASLVPVLRAASYDSSTRSKGDHGDPTLNTVSALDAIEYHRQAILRAIEYIGEDIDALDKLCRAALGYRAHIPANDADPAWDSTPKRLCIGWPGMPPEQTCNHYPDERDIGGRTDGRCVTCGPAYDRLQAQREAERAERLAERASYMRQYRRGERTA